MLIRLCRRSRSREGPVNLQQLRRRDPCWCGSGKGYGRCHRRQDRRRLKEALGGEGKAAWQRAFL